MSVWVAAGLPAEGSAQAGVLPADGDWSQHGGSAEQSSAHEGTAGCWLGHRSVRDSFRGLENLLTKKIFLP